MKCSSRWKNTYTGVGTPGGVASLSLPLPLSLPTDTSPALLIPLELSRVTEEQGSGEDRDQVFLAYYHCHYYYHLVYSYYSYYYSYQNSCYYDNILLHAFTTLFWEVTKVRDQESLTPSPSPPPLVYYYYYYY